MLTRMPQTPTLLLLLLLSLSAVLLSAQEDGFVYTGFRGGGAGSSSNNQSISLNGDAEIEDNEILQLISCGLVFSLALPLFRRLLSGGSHSTSSCIHPLPCHSGSSSRGQRIPSDTASGKVPLCLVHPSLAGQRSPFDIASRSPPNTDDLAASPPSFSLIVTCSAHSHTCKVPLCSAQGYAREHGARHSTRSTIISDFLRQRMLIVAFTRKERGSRLKRNSFPTTSRQ